MLRDTAATTVIASQDIEPALAEQMYSRIENPQLRSNAAAQLYYRFRTSDPALAERYRRESAVPAVTPMGR